MDDRVQYASPSSVRVLGFQPDQLVDRPAFAGVNEEDLPGVEETVAALKRGEAEEARITYRARHLEKSEIWVESTLRVTRSVNGEIDGAVAITRDITRQKDLEEKLETFATQDGLTGIANRRRFDERLLEEWARAYRERTRLGLLMIDLDHFKQFNDSYGHQVGDECLRLVARILGEGGAAEPPIYRSDTAERSSPCCCRIRMRRAARGSLRGSVARFWRPQYLMR